jgi:hypothetical protein
MTLDAGEWVDHHGGPHDYLLWYNGEWASGKPGSVQPMHGALQFRQKLTPLFH